MTDSPPPGEQGPTPQPWFPPAGEPGAGQWPAPPGSGPPGAGHGAPSPGAPGYGQPPGYGPPTGYGTSPGYGQPPGYGQRPGYGTGPRYGEAAPKPGVIPLRPLGLGEILDGAFATIRRRPGPVLGIAAVVLTGSTVISTILSRGLLSVPNPGPHLTTRQVEHQLGHFLAGAVPLFAALVLLNVIVRAVLAGLLAPIIAREVAGRQLSAGDAWRAAAPRLPALLGATLLVLVASLVPAAILAAILLVATAAGATPAAFAIIAVLVGLPALLATIAVPVMLSLVTPVVVLEGAGPWTALGRSWRLVWRSFWRVFGILLLAWIITAVTAGILELPFGFLATVLPGVAGTVVSVLGGIAAGTVTQPITAAVTVLLYVDRRMRTEGLDLALRTAAGQGTPMDEAGFAAAWRPPADGGATGPSQPPAAGAAADPGPPAAASSPPPL
jgi:hypothetical protein